MQPLHFTWNVFEKQGHKFIPWHIIFTAMISILFFIAESSISYSSPPVFSTIDLLLNDLSLRKTAFEADVQREYGNNPQVNIIPLVQGNTDLEANLEANLDLFVKSGIPWVDFVAVEGGGLVWIESTTLSGLAHSGFDYDAQYQDSNPEEDLTVDETEAKKRYVVAYNAVPLIIEKAHAKGLKVSVNVESLAHIINTAEESGIGGEKDTLSIAENLPAPNLEQFREFIQEIINAGPDAVSAEAFSSEYDDILAQMLSQAGISYWHTGAGLGNVWVGYYYSAYPAVAGDLLAYNYLHTIDGQMAMTNIDIYARARAQSASVKTSLVVGAYNPLPCDLSLAVSDLYSENRSGDTNWIDNENPTRPDGTPVQNCAVQFWRNLVLFGVLTQQPDMVLICADLAPSVEAALDLKLGGRISDRLSEHTYTPPPLPVANIIVDVPNFDSSDDGFSNEDYLELIGITILPIVSDGLEAAGLRTVLTEGSPWTGDVALTYIITPGGNEDNGEEGAMGAPYWCAAQDLPGSLVSLLDTSAHSGPVFIHPIMGIPGTSGWQIVRSRFGLPPAFLYKDHALTSYEEGRTSLISSILVDSNGDTLINEKGRMIKAPIAPETGEVMGFTVRLPSYLDDTLGQTANLISTDEVKSGNIIAMGPVLINTHDGSGSNITSEQRTAPYLIGDGAGRYLWTINQLHHEAFTYILSKTAAKALGTTAPLDAPACVQMRGGLQTAALAYDKTELRFRLPLDKGALVRIRIYDYLGELSSSETVSYSAPLIRSLNKRSLLVAEPVLSVPGDIDNNGTVNLLDAILAIRIVSNNPAGTIFKWADADRDGKIGTEDAVFILQAISGLRQMHP